MDNEIVILSLTSSNIESIRTFSLNTTFLPGELITVYSVISKENQYFIQHRRANEVDSFFIHAYKEEREVFSTLGEAVGVLINEIMGESNV